MAKDDLNKPTHRRLLSPVLVAAEVRGVQTPAKPQAGNAPSSQPRPDYRVKGSELFPTGRRYRSGQEKRLFR